MVEPIVLGRVEGPVEVVYLDTSVRACRCAVSADCGTDGVHYQDCPEHGEGMPRMPRHLLKQAHRLAGAVDRWIAEV